jgi:UDP-N-acetyl-D-glucosamine dehydrogenase
LNARTQDFAVIGLGYVGLPLAIAATLSGGLKGFGLDTSSQTVAALNAGRSHVDDISATSVADARSHGFFATTDPHQLSSAETIVICVPTPLSSDGGPDLRSVRDSVETIAQHVSKGSLVVLESTTWPGTTEELVAPILAEHGFTIGEDIYLAFSPERIDPGNPTYGLRNTPKIVSGVTSQCRERAATFYAHFIDEIVLASGTREAEMAKLLENTYRQINIALVNEMAKFSHELDIDIWEVIRCASTKPFGFASFRPGAGVGGHCIPIDPSYLSHRVQSRLGYPFRFVELAQEINRSMPRYVVQRAQDLLNDHGRALKGARVGILGVTYKPGIADQRESPAVPVANGLHRLGAQLSYFDPFVSTWDLDAVRLESVDSPRSLVAESDLVVHLQPSDTYPNDLFATSHALVLDTTGRLSGDNVHRL